MPNPEPDNIGAIFYAGCPIVDAHAGRPHPPDLLEVKRRMPRVASEQLVVLISKLFSLGNCS
jgi:hypothetical protein